MVGIVPRSVKLMELAELFSWKAKKLLSRGFGSLTIRGAPVAPCRGNVCPSQVLDFGPLAPRGDVSWAARFLRSCPSPHPLRFGIFGKSSKARSPDSDHGRSQKWWLLEVNQTFGYLKIMGRFEQLSFEGS